MGGEQVHYNRDLLKGNHSRWGRGGMCPWCPPGSATYAATSWQIVYMAVWLWVVL